MKKAPAGTILQRPLFTTPDFTGSFRRRFFQTFCFNTLFYGLPPLFLQGRVVPEAIARLVLHREVLATFHAASSLGWGGYSFLGYRITKALAAFSQERTMGKTITRS